MGYIGDKCKDLKAINISGCITLTDEGILQLTQVSKINSAIHELLLSNYYSLYSKCNLGIKQR